MELSLLTLVEKNVVESRELVVKLLFNRLEEKENSVNDNNERAVLVGRV